MTAATRSKAEWAASDKIPKLPVVIPTTNFSAVIPIAAYTEFRATARFSARIASVPSTAAGLLMGTLSPTAAVRSPASAATQRPRDETRSHPHVYCPFAVYLLDNSTKEARQYFYTHT